MSELDDAKEWASLADIVEEHLAQEGVSYNKNAPVPTSRDKKDVAPGQPTQYALYADGYTATTDTIKTLPAGCYDIHADNKCTYVTPTLKSSGLLLELPEMRSGDVIKIVETFWNSESDYKDGNEFVIGGATFKSGIMIFGVPGSGKSKTIQLVTNKLIERGGTVFHASCPPSYLGSFLSDFARIEPNRKSIVILEDMDSLIEKYREAEYLEILDSAKTINNVMFIATTNYPDRLDPRIFNRPGRLAHVIKVGLPTAKAREAYLKAILKNHRDVEYIVANTDGFTIDHLSALINSTYREKKNLEQEIKRLRVLFKAPKSDHKPLGIGIERDPND